jgi:hypothetical protein
MRRTLAHPLTFHLTRAADFLAILNFGHHPSLLTGTAFVVATAVLSVLIEIREHMLLATTADLATHPGSTNTEITHRLGGNTSTTRLTLRQLTRSCIANADGDRFTLN